MRIDFIEENIRKKLQSFGDSYWSQYDSSLDVIVNSYNPISKLKLCVDSSKFSDSLTLIGLRGNKFIGELVGGGCYEFNIVLNSNRVKPQNNQSRITTFFASAGYDINPTVHRLSLKKGIKIKKLYAKYLSALDFSELEINNAKPRYSNALHNIPFGA